MPNAKNFALQPAAADLGFGDAIMAQLSDQEKERKNKMLQLSKASQAGSAGNDLFGMGQKLLPGA